MAAMAKNETDSSSTGVSAHGVAKASADKSGIGTVKAEYSASADATKGLNASGSVGAHVFEHEDEKAYNTKIEALGVKAGADAGVDLRQGTAGAEVTAKAQMIDASNDVGGVTLGAGVSTGVKVGKNNEVKIAGVGASVGVDKVGISVFDNEVYISPSGIAKTLFGGGK